MTRQYIGARYVPKFYEDENHSNQWKYGIPYEPLTIVTYMGNSYTSKRNVPADCGYPNENPYYWVLTGNYNSQINSLSQQVTELSGDVGDLNENLQDLADIVNESGIERRFVFIMDSFGGHILDYVVADLGLDSSHYWATWNGGSGFNTTGDQFPNFKTMLQRLTVPNPQKITDVVVIGGINDGGSVYTPEDARAGFDEFYDYAKGRFVNAKIWWGRDGVITTASGDGLQKRAQEIRAYSGMMSSTKPYIYMKGIDDCLLDNNNKETDGIHPTENGSKIFATKIASCLRGGSAGYLTTGVHSVTITPVTGITVAGAIQQYRENDVCHTNVRTLTLNGSWQIGDGINIKVGSIDSKLLRGGFYNQAGVAHLDLGTAYGVIVDTDNRTRKVEISLTLDVNNDLYLEVRSPLYFSVKSDGTVEMYSNSIKQIVLYYLNNETSGLQN